MFFLVALSIGFLGSFHCIGMCGPIALSIPVNNNSPLTKLAGSLVYNSGRIITYAIMGLLFGLLGRGFVLAGWQNILSVTLGVFILVLLLIPRFSMLSIQSGMPARLLESVKGQMRALFGVDSFKSLLLIGLLNGLLPCGLVYLGVAGSLATGSPVKGALFMAGFGLGTFPAMVFITLARDYISVRFRQRIRAAVPVFAGIMAVMLILRGLNLGIPYISPAIEVHEGMTRANCCNP
jgi:sulfite exporter TauE/SafE